MREHYESVARQTGVVPEQLLGPECPEELLHLWEYFGRLNLRRGSSDEGFPLPISNVEIQAWQSMNGISLSTLEVEVLDGLESIFLSHWRERATKAASK